MDATAIPDDEVPWNARRMVMGPPAGQDPTGDIRSIEMLHRMQGVVLNGDPMPCYSARFVLSEEEREVLLAGKPLWVSFYGQVTPFDIQIGDMT